MHSSLDHLKDAKFNGVKGLADITEQVLRSIGSSQGKGTVTEYPNERTIRYYLTEGLLPQPSDKQGLTSVFGYDHLLTLLVIKKLQADGLPISVIKTLISGKSVHDLEVLLGEEVQVFTDRSSLNEYRASTGHTDDDEVMEIAFDSADFSEPAVEAEPGPNRAKEYLESLLLNKSKSSREDEDTGPLFSMIAPPPVSAPESPQSTVENWKRYTITKGVEIHIEKNYKPPRNEQERVRIIDLIERILNFRSRK